jgi:hypothetical protein
MLPKKKKKKDIMKLNSQINNLTLYNKIEIENKK